MAIEYILDAVTFHILPYMAKQNKLNVISPSNHLTFRLDYGLLLELRTCSYFSHPFLCALELVRTQSDNSLPVTDFTSVVLIKTLPGVPHKQ